MPLILFGSSHRKERTVSCVEIWNFASFSISFACLWTGFFKFTTLYLNSD
jgi:hypothetical protein